MKSKTERDEVADYARDVVEQRTPACRWVRLACQRHLDDLKRDDIWFDKKAATRFFRYCERYLKHYKGPMRGKPIVLEPWQKFVFGNIYGWKKVVDDELTDLWRYNFIYIEVPRKNGKTTLCAAGASYDCALIEDTGAEVYCLATKEDQAKLLYKDVAAYISQSDDLAEVFEILKGQNTIFGKESSRTSFIKPLGSDSNKQDGLNPLAVYCDELHAWPDRGLWDVMEEAFGARDNWHMVSITTAGNNRESICWEQRSHVINVLEKRITADNQFGVIFTVDDTQKNNWKDPANWHIANPNLGCGKQLTYMENRCERASQIPGSLNQFLNKQLNIWTDVAEAWLDTDQWNECIEVFEPLDLRGKRCHIGLDLARVNDLSAVAYVFPRQNSLDKVHLLVDFYLPKDEIKRKAHRDKLDYPLYHKQGWLTLTDGKTTDYEYIRHDIRNKTKATGFKVLEINYDRHFAGELVQTLTNDGYKMEEVGMGFISMASPTAEFERLVIKRGLVHNNNPILNWNASNVVIRRDAAGNMKPDKELSIRKIDGIVAAIMALGRTPLGKGPSVYESRGLLSLGSK